ncbi:MAG: hypothetical protein IPP32_15575 [Bacteroidetes bacterium]|nr:hypothetical protein [Bacteroidota bacterium]
MDKFYKIGYGIAIIISIGFAFYYTSACKSGTSYVGDKYSQFDERIALLDVNALLHPGDAKHFVFSVISGSTLFYGRVMMWTDALVSFIPDKIWGIEGQVMATRLCHFFVLLLSIHLLITLFIKDALLRLMTLVFILVSPYFIYFSFIPKPEPFVLLFLALFLRGFIKNNWSFGRHFIWLGFAYGCKISVLPLIPILFVLPLFYSEQKFRFALKIKEFSISVLYTLLGFLLCIPCLFLAPVKRLFLQSYISQAFGSATKSYDDKSINGLTWMNKLLHEYYAIHSIIISIAILGLAALAIYYLIKCKKISNAHLLLGLGLVQLLLIFILTKRIWPHYMFVGVCLSTIAGAALLEGVVKKQLKLVSLVIFACMLPQALTFANDARSLANRENNSNYQNVKKGGEQAMEYLLQKGVKKIGIDLSTYVANKYIVVGNKYEPFPALKSDADLKFDFLLEYGITLYTSGNQAIIFEKNCPCDTIATGSNEYFMKDALAAYNSNVPSHYHLDTTFAATRVYLHNDFRK